MQLQFTERERNLLLVALGHPWDDPRYRSVCARLIEMVVAHDFGFGYDELEDLIEILSDACRCDEMKGEEVELGAIIDKLTEAMAMA